MCMCMFVHVYKQNKKGAIDITKPPLSIYVCIVSNQQVQQVLRRVSAQLRHYSMNFLVNIKFHMVSFNYNCKPVSILLLTAKVGQ